jgi:hypothetical protein
VAATAAAILALPAIAAPARAQEHEVGHWMPLGSYSTTKAGAQPRPLDDLPKAPVLRGSSTPPGAGGSYVTGYFAMKLDGVKSGPQPSGQKFTLFAPTGKPVRAKR